MMKTLKIILLLLCIASCKCTDIEAPKVFTFPALPDQGSRYVLYTPPKLGYKVQWSGPQGTFTGNPLIIENITDREKGAYSVKYVKIKGRHCISNTAIISVDIKKCPDLPTPTIVASEEMIAQGTKFIIGVQHIDDVDVKWIGPDTTYFGNPWIRENVTTEMSGNYKAQYIYKNISNCESAISEKPLQITDRTIETIYEGQKYFLEIDKNENAATIWLRANKSSNDPIKDIKVGHVEKYNMPRLKVDETICKFVNILDKGELLVGCLSAAGAAGCAFGIAATGGSAIPVCVFFLETAPAALTTCVMGLAGEIASSLSKDTSWATSNAGIAIANAELTGALRNMIQMACITKAGREPLFKEGNYIEKPIPAPIPAPAPTPVAAGSGGRDTGHNGTGGQRNTNQSGGSAGNNGTRSGNSGSRSGNNGGGSIGRPLP